MYYTEGKQLPSNKWCACSTLNYMYVCMYLSGVVGGDRVGGAVVWGRRLVAEGLEGGVSFVLDAF